MSTTDSTARLLPRTFGQGGQEPYENALTRGTGQLTLLPLNPAGQPAGSSTGQPPGPAVQPALRQANFRVQDWCRAATAPELALLLSLRGPILDVGCGPGRILTAAAGLGLRCIGVDTSPTAVALARSRGAAVLEQSIFDPLPHEGEWGSAMLLDGNIGIGGHPERLLSRLASVVAVGGTAVVEVDPVAARDSRYQAVLADASGRRSAAFPWAVLGAEALERAAAGTGWVPAGVDHTAGRVFSRLVRYSG